MAGQPALAAAADAAEDALRVGLESAAGAPARQGTVAGWTASLAGLQRVIDIASAAQDLALARLAAIEVEVAEDGTLVERHRAPGHVSLDAPPLASGALTTTAAHAERRVWSAVRLAADGPEGTSSSTGLGGLHAAMADGRLDAYRADVVATELEEAPPEVAATVVASLEPYLTTETGPELRRRCRRMLARISPDLLRQRARRARSESRLERWASEPGVDTWHGTFPSEEAVHAWAAVDALAQRYVAEGTCERMDRARAKALTDLVTGNATVETHLVLTVPDEAMHAASTGPGATPAEPGATPPKPGATPAEPGATRAEAGSTRAEAGSTPAEPGATRAEAGATPAEPGATPAEAGSSREEAARSGALAVPGAPVAGTSRGPDGHDERASARGVPTHPEDLVEVPGARASEILLVPRGWLSGLTRDTAHAAGGAGGSRRRRRATRVERCHPVTGAMLPTPVSPDPDPPGSPDPPAGRDLPRRPGGASRTTAPSTEPGSYRPSRSVAEQVRARDVRCRFPGCHVGARFCDLDHVRPWPCGPTATDNLICLCRRHHRTKQRPGWRVHLASDGTVTWTDPTGRTRSSAPADLLHQIVLPHRSDEPGPHPSRPRLALPDGPHSALEYHVEHLIVCRRGHIPRDEPIHRRTVSNPDSDDPPF